MQNLEPQAGSEAREWLGLALSRPVRRRALRTLLLVGSILISVNHGDALLRGDVPPGRALRILLTLAVPYLVSTVSSVQAIREALRQTRTTLPLEPAGQGSPLQLATSSGRTESW